MITIKVTASKSYDVVIGAGLLDNLGTHLMSVLKKPCKVAIISDSNVWPLYGKSVENSLAQAGFTVVNFVFPAGDRICVLPAVRCQYEETENVPD